jgi:hypothetical protein
MNGNGGAPRLLPLTLALSVLLWIIATTGGRHLFVKEVLGEAFDSQGEHLLRGDPGVDVSAIRSEAIIVNGKVRMYFGPFPALFRIPLNLVYPAGRGSWSRLSGFCAGVIALFSFGGLIGDSLRSSPLSSRARNWIGNACVAGFVLATPFLFLLGSLSIYNEAIIWGLAWALAGLFFACRSVNSHGRALTYSLLGFSFSAAAALLSRVTFGMPLVLIAPALALRVRQAGWIRLFALAGPLVVGVAFYLLLSYAKFGNFSGLSYENYVDPVHRQFVRQHGMLNLTRVPYSFADYFSLHPPTFRSQPPFVRVDRHFLSHPSFYSLPFSETYLSIPWSSGWLALGAVFGIICLFQSTRSNWFQRWIAVALLTELVCILAYFALAQRYAADLCPFLIFCLAVFLRNGGAFAQRVAIVGLLLASMALNLLATATWVSRDANLPIETRAFWSAIAGKEQPPTAPKKK